MTSVFRTPVFSNTLGRPFPLMEESNLILYPVDVVGDPFKNYDYPNPKGYLSNDLKTWTVFNLNLAPPPVIVTDSTHILRNSNFTRSIVRYVDLNQQFINTVVLTTVTPPPSVDTTHILRSPVFTKFEIKQVDTKQLIPNLLTTTLGFIGPKPFNLNEWPNTLLKVLREFGNVYSSYLIGGIPLPPPPPPAPTFAGRIVTIEEWDTGAIHARPYREGMKQVIIREAAKALGRQGGIASGKTRRRS